MYQRHAPDFYIAGIYIHQTNVWCGEFAASIDELFDYAQNDVRSVEEYTIVLDMVQAQQVYSLWWDRVRNT